MAESLSKTQVRLALGLVAAAALLVEVTLVRLLSVALWYPFAFAVLATAMLGFGASAVMLCHWPRLRDLPSPRALPSAALGLAAVTALGYPLWNRLPVDPMSIGQEPWQVLWLLLFLLALTLPFVAAGLFVAKSFAASAVDAPSLYAADLGGAGLGVLMYVVAMPNLGGPGTLYVGAGLATLAAMVLLWAKLGSRLILGMVVMALFATATRIEAVVPLRITENKLLGSREAKALPRGSEWTLSSAIDVIEPNKEAMPIIVIDGGTALSWVPRAPKNDARPKAVGLRAAPYALGGTDAALVIGSGGGMEVEAALASGVRRVLAIEIDPAINRLVTGRLNNILGGLFHRPEVELRTGEARAEIGASPEQFDAIVAFHTISNAASATGAMSMAESYLLTTEAMRLLLRRLSAHGVLMMSRPEAQMGRLLATLAAAWEGPGDLANHLVVVTQTTARPDFLCAVLLRRTPLDAEALAALKPFVPGRIAYAPDGSGDSQAFFAAALATPPLADDVVAPLTAALPYRPATLTPVTDNRPFFNLLRPWHELSLADVTAVLHSGVRARDRLEDLPVGQVAILLVLLLAGGLAALLLVPTAWRLRHEPAARQSVAKVAGYFGALGFCYIVLEVVLIQTFTRILGEPAVSMIAVLATLLVASGLGSWWFVHQRHWPPHHGAIAAASAALVVALVAPAIANLVETTPLAVRVSVAVLTVIPVGMLMGIPFSAQLAELPSEALVGWAWANNSVFSVAGSIAALICASAFGFATTALVACLGYLAAAWLSRPKASAA